jgi:hypothetical protein
MRWDEHRLMRVHLNIAAGGSVLYRLIWDYRLLRLKRLSRFEILRIPIFYMLRSIELSAACISSKVLLPTARSIYRRVTFPLSPSRSVQTPPLAHFHCSGQSPSCTSRTRVPSSIGIICRTICCALSPRGKSVRGHVATGLGLWVTSYC